MAIQAITSVSALAPGVKLVTWAAAANGDTAGGSATLEGSNDGTNFAACSNQAGTTIAKTSAGLAQVAERPPQIRPHVTAGDGTTALVCTATVRRRSR